MGPLAAARIAHAPRGPSSSRSPTQRSRRARVHLKLDTGMGRYGFRSCRDAPRERRRADEPSRDGGLGPGVRARAARALPRVVPAVPRQLERHVANSAAALRLPEARFDAARCGVALYGLSPFGDDPADDGLEPVLRWRSYLAQVKLLEPGESTGYGRRFVAAEPTWIGLVPVGYADGFRRDLTGTEVLVDGEPRPVVGTVSMDSFAVELDRELPVARRSRCSATACCAEEHARVAGTINYELVPASSPIRARAAVIGG